MPVRKRLYAMLTAATNTLAAGRCPQTQQEVADALGCGQWLYLMFETGMVLPSPEVLEPMSALFGKTVEKLYDDLRSRAFYGGSLRNR